MSNRSEIPPRNLCRCDAPEILFGGGATGPLALLGHMARETTSEANHVVGAVHLEVPVLEAAETEAHHLR